ncbi:hypothetical protein H7K62_16720, partial [Quadrisphaera sp. RL12-1S]|nr:hypothetical protein [Quadrisphaera sp. RL12-1S]
RPAHSGFGAGPAGPVAPRTGQQPAVAAPARAAGPRTGQTPAVAPADRPSWQQPARAAAPSPYGEQQPVRQQQPAPQAEGRDGYGEQYDAGYSDWRSPQGTPSALDDGPGAEPAPAPAYASNQLPGQYDGGHNGVHTGSHGVVEREPARARYGRSEPEDLDVPDFLK